MEPLKVGDIIGMKGSYHGTEGLLIDIKRGGGGDKGIIISFTDFQIYGREPLVYLDNYEKRNVYLSKEQLAKIDKALATYNPELMIKEATGGRRKTRRSKNKHRHSKNKHRHTRRN